MKLFLVIFSYAGNLKITIYFFKITLNVMTSDFINIIKKVFQTNLHRLLTKQNIIVFYDFLFHKIFYWLFVQAFRIRMSRKRISLEQQINSNLPNLFYYSGERPTNTTSTIDGAFQSLPLSFSSHRQ